MMPFSRNSLLNPLGSMGNHRQYTGRQQMPDPNQMSRFNLMQNSVNAGMNGYTNNAPYTFDQTGYYDHSGYPDDHIGAMNNLGMQDYNQPDYSQDFQNQPMIPTGNMMSRLDILNGMQGNPNAIMNGRAPYPMNNQYPQNPSMYNPPSSNNIGSMNESAMFNPSGQDFNPYMMPDFPSIHKTIPNEFINLLKSKNPSMVSQPSYPSLRQGATNKLLTQRNILMAQRRGKPVVGRRIR